MSDQDFADRPATFREVLASGEYRALYLASALSWFGDYVARAAVTSLVYQQTGSVAASAATFAISYVPWLGLGPILAALAERLPFRSTMITADVLRMVLIALVALPGMPVWGMITLLFMTSLCNPPFDAARSALLAKVLTGDRYVVGMTLQTTSHQAAQVAGYLSGAGLSAVDPQAALLFNSVTFGVSALLIALQVQPRPAALPKEERTDLLRETASGIKLVFGAPLLRGVAVLVFLTGLFAVVPEGLAAAWAATLSDDPDLRGWAQGAIMISNPVGFIVGGLVVGRVLGPRRRQRIIPVFAIAVPASLAPALLGPPVAGVMLLSFLCGVATAGLIPATNGLFVQALPNTYRARAFGVMKSGIQVLQGLGVFVTGWLADQFALTTVVGLWGLFGIALMAVAVLTWPNAEQIAAEIARAQEQNRAGETQAAAVAGTTAEPPTAAPRRPRPRRWADDGSDPAHGRGAEHNADPWGYLAGHPADLPRSGTPAVGRARVVPGPPAPASEQAQRPQPAATGRHSAADGPAHRPLGDPGTGHSGGGRHSSDRVRRRISQPVGRIYSTESARNRAAANQEPRPAAQSPPSPRPRSTPAAPESDSAGAVAGPRTTDPQWYPLADPPGPAGADAWPSPEAAGWGAENQPPRGAQPQAIQQHAIQQHAAHQHALQQQRAEQPGRPAGPAGTMDG